MGSIGRLRHRVPGIVSASIYSMGSEFENAIGCPGRVDSVTA